MCNRIAYNSKVISHLINVCLSVLILSCTIPTWADSDQSITVNIYLKLPPKNDIQNYGRQFEQLLIKEKNLATYQLKPIFKNHPLHVTLYLTQYPFKHQKLLIKRIKHLAQTYHPFTITAQGLTVAPSRYVMLTVKPQPYLQQLSNATVLAASPLRSPQAIIPSWVSGNVQKIKSFKMYGSPNTFANYMPHFTFMSPEISYSALEEKNIYQYLQHLVTEFNERYADAVKAKVNAIGIGIADKQGQITKELASFTL